MVVHNQDGRSSKGTPAELLEWELAKEFGWTPNQIEKIPMKKLQRLLLVGKVKGEIAESKHRADQWKAQNASPQRGAGKQYREV